LLFYPYVPQYLPPHTSQEEEEEEDESSSSPSKKKKNNHTMRLYDELPSLYYHSKRARTSTTHSAQLFINLILSHRDAMSLILSYLPPKHILSTIGSVNHACRIATQVRRRRRRRRSGGRGDSHSRRRRSSSSSSSSSSATAIVVIGGGVAAFE